MLLNLIHHHYFSTHDKVIVSVARGCTTSSLATLVYPLIKNQMTSTTLNNKRSEVID